MSETLDTNPGFSLKNLLLLLLPLALLAVVIWVFLNTNAGLNFNVPVPIEDITVERVVFPSEHEIEIHVRNSGPDAVRIAQVAINDGFRTFIVIPQPEIPRLNTAIIRLNYGWVEGEAYAITIFTTNAVPIDVEVPVAFLTPEPSGANFLGFTLIGVYVGLIPIFLGLLWFPALRSLGKGWMTFLMAITIGLLIFLGLDTVSEALEQAAEVPPPFQGIGLIGIGAVATFLLLDAISRRQSATAGEGSTRRLGVAYLIALGIGLHNLGEGLAIGAAYNVGEVALGTFLVVGFIIQNITEGLGIIAPILRDRPRFSHLVWLGVLGGAPAIVGSWLGAFTPSATLAVLFLGIGAGAIFEVVYEIAKMIKKDMENMPMVVFAGVLAGMLLLWGTGLLIK